MSSTALTKPSTTLTHLDDLPFGQRDQITYIRANDENATHLFSVLRQRMGWSDSIIAQLDAPEHPPMRDIDEIVKALHWIKTTGKKLVVLPDFDMDGISAGVLGYAGFAELGFDVELYVPDYKRGHDIHPDAIDELVSRHPGVGAVITCDGGVNSHPGIQRGRDLGLVMLVTDHHVQLPTDEDGSAASPAHLIIDPDRIDETYSHRTICVDDATGLTEERRAAICGAFVLHQVLMAYAQTHAPGYIDNIGLLKLFAGIGTVGDVMPLRFENRQLVRDSLSIARMLRHGIPAEDTVTEYDVNESVLMTLLNAGNHHPVFVAAFRGFGYVLQTWREAGSLRTINDLQADFYGFYLAPAFNAARRIGAPLSVAFDVFTHTNPDEQYNAAQKIIEWNELRKEQTEQWVEEILNRDQPLAPFVWLTDAPSGMLGLLAGKLMSEHGVPVIVIHDVGDPNLPCSGSARAPSWFQVIATLAEHGHFAIGHEQACGVRASSLAELAEIAQVLSDETAVVQAQLALLQQSDDAPLEYDLVLGPTVARRTQPDGTLSNVETALELARRIESFAPFGHQFPRPRIRLIVNLAQCSMQVLGDDETHLKIVLPSGMKLLWWNAAGQLPDLRDLAESARPGESVVEFDVDLSLNHYMGDQFPQAVIERYVQHEH
ncbi:MAG TPA: DHH family phosphoesterase [Candidatus Lumbricidophila sp.]|nr:DHH family phosphoesterase [Candidatus Lumbricidophila sp.]